MFVLKCDVCKKSITDRETAVKAGVGYNSFELCKKCGATISRVLKNYKLIK